MASAIDAIVDAYVSAGNIEALDVMKAHRVALLERSGDRDGYSFAVIRKDIDADIAAIDSAILRLRPEHAAPSMTPSDD